MSSAQSRWRAKRNAPRNISHSFGVLDCLPSLFGVSTIALAVGGSLGNLLGSPLYGASTSNGLPVVP